jgi:hypothetical protein
MMLFNKSTTNPDITVWVKKRHIYDFCSESDWKDFGYFQKLLYTVSEVIRIRDEQFGIIGPWEV